jgi:hypothetical protein
MRKEQATILRDERMVRCHAQTAMLPYQECDVRGQGTITLGEISKRVGSCAAAGYREEVR